MTKHFFRWVKNLDKIRYDVWWEFSQNAQKFLSQLLLFCLGIFGVFDINLHRISNVFWRSSCLLCLSTCSAVHFTVEFFLELADLDPTTTPCEPISTPDPTITPYPMLSSREATHKAKLVPKAFFLFYWRGGEQRKSPENEICIRQEKINSGQ